MAFLPAWRLDTTPPDYVVEGMIPELGIGIAYGPSTHGKSTVAFKLAMDIVNGVPFFGHPVARGQVVYCLGEGLYDAGVRKEAIIADSVRVVPLENCRGGCTGAECRCTETVHMTDEGLFLMSEPFSLAHERDLRAAITQMKRLVPDLRLVIIDALSDFNGGTSLEFPTPAGRVIAGMKQMSRELECAVLAVHHTGNDPSRMRGAKRLFDASDFVIRIADGTISSEKQKSGPPFAPASFWLEPVGWVDPETGKLVETVVAKEVLDEAEDIPAPPPREAQPPVLIRGQQLTGRKPKRTGLRDPVAAQFTKAQYRAGGAGVFLACVLLSLWQTCHR